VALPQIISRVLVKPVPLADEQPPNLSHSNVLLQSNGVLYQMDWEIQIGPKIVRYLREKKEQEQ
jgi:hypothetical protein